MLRLFRYGIAVVLTFLLVPFGAKTGHAAVDYGSGLLGNWTLYSKSFSPIAVIRQTNVADGLYLVGDSVTMRTFAQLTQMLAPSHNMLAHNIWNARPTTPAVDSLTTWVHTYGAPHRFLIATGSNDIFNPPVMAAQIDRVMRLAGPTRKVFWVSVYCSRWHSGATIQAADKRNSIWVNRQIYAAAKRWPKLIVIPWDTWLSRRPSRYKMYLDDGVHTNTAGSIFRNTIIRDAILKAG